MKYDTITRAGKGQGGTGGGSEWCCGVCGHWDLADRHKKGKEEKRGSRRRRSSGAWAVNLATGAS